MIHTRAFMKVGVFVNVTLHVAFGVIPFLWILVIVVGGFSHALWVLAADFTPANGTTNSFATFVMSAKYTTLAMVGDPTGFKNIDNQWWAVDLYRTIFALITGVFFFNILIAVLNYNYTGA